MRLTDYQKKILLLLKEGKSYNQTAQALNSSKKAVAAVLTYVARRNGYSSITDLRKAIKYVDLHRPVSAKNGRVRGIRETESGTYKARIWHHGKYLHLGTYRTEPQAVAARLEAEKAYRE